MLRWCKDFKPLRNSHKRSGNHFISTLKIFDLLICATVIPCAFAVLVVDSAHNLELCFIKEGLVMLASSGSSFSVLLIAVDRYFAVVAPTKFALTPTRVRRCRIAVVIISLVGLCLPSLSLLMGQYQAGLLESVKVLPCRNVIWLFQPCYLYEIYYIFSFLVAVITTLLCYNSVLKVVRRRLLLKVTTSSSNAQNIENATVERCRRQELKATRVAFAVIVSFLVCWGPHMVVTVVQFLLPENLMVDLVQTVCLVVAFIAPIIHPVIYSYETKENSSSDNFTFANLPVVCIQWFKGGSKVTPEPTNTNVENAEQSQVTTSIIHLRNSRTSSTGNTPSDLAAEHTV
ncbi:hypothetical protein ACF0H5_007454 [Mactra antiquata]